MQNLVQLLTLWVAAVSAIIAYYTYRKKEHDFKRSCARMIVYDIRHIDSIKQQRNEQWISFYVEHGFNLDNWNRNKHLFINDLSNDDFKIIDKYFLVSTQIVKRIKNLSDIQWYHSKILDGLILNAQIASNTINAAITVPSWRDWIEAKFETGEIDKLFETIIPNVIWTTWYDKICKIAF